MNDKLQGFAPNEPPASSLRQAKRPPRRKRDPEGSKLRLLEAAKREFSTRGLDGARVHRIASRARVNKQMVYHYFGSKEELYVATLEDAYTQFRKRDAVAIDDLAPEAAIAALVGSVFDGIMALEDTVALIVDANRHRGRHVRKSKSISALHDPLISSIRNVLEKGARRNVFRKNIDPVWFFVSVLGMCSIYVTNAYTLSAIFNREFRDPSEISSWRTYVVDTALRSIRQKK